MGGFGRAERIGGAEYELDLDTGKFHSEAMRAEAAFDRVSKRIDDAGQRMSRAGRVLTVGLTAPVIAAAVASTKLAVDFDTSLSRITGLVGDSAESVREWRGELLTLGPEIARGPKELADALYFVRSSGIAAGDSLGVVEAAGKAAAAGLGNTAIIAQAVTSAMNAYGPEVLSAAQATSILIATVREGKSEPEELANSIGRVIPIAAQLGVTFDQVGAALASMTLFGLDTEESATALRGVFATLLKPSAQANDVLKAVGLSARGLREELKEKGLLSVLTTLSGALAGNEDALAAVIPNVRALTGFLSLAGKNADQVEGIFASLAATTEQDLARAFEVAAGTPGFKLRQAFVQAQAAAIRFGDTLAPVLTGQVIPALNGALDVLDDLIAVFANLSPHAQNTVIIMVALAAALGPILVLVGSIASGVGALAGLMGVLGISVGFLLPGALLIVGLGVIVAAIIDMKIQTDGASTAALNLKTAWYQAEIGILQVISDIESGILNGILSPINAVGTALGKISGGKLEFSVDASDLGDNAADKAIKIVRARIAGVQAEIGNREAAEFVGGGSIERARDIDPSAAAAGIEVDNLVGGIVLLGASAGGLGASAAGAAADLDPLADGIIDLAEAIAHGLSDQEVVTLELADAAKEAANESYRARIGLLTLARVFPGLNGEGIRLAVGLAAIQDHLARTGQTIQQFIRDTAADALDSARSLASQILGRPTRETLELELKQAELRKRRALILQGGGTEKELEKRLKPIDAELEALQRVIDVRRAEFDILRLKNQLADQSIDTDTKAIGAVVYLTAVMGNLSLAATDAVAALQDMAGVGTTQALPANATGIRNVPTTGPRIVHRGEEIVTAAAARSSGPMVQASVTFNVLDWSKARADWMRFFDEDIQRQRAGGQFVEAGAFRGRRL